MNFDFAQFWPFVFRYIFPPVFYAFHGYLATEMAIWALFHPYKPWFILGWQIPCTPGILPKRQAKLADAVASTVTDTLLTASDIRTQAESLVTEKNIYLAVDAFVTSVVREFRDTAKLHRLASDISELSPALLEQLVISTIDGVESGRDQRVSGITEKIFDQVIMSARISLDQANEIAARVMDSVLTPTNIRKTLLTLLSPQNIAALDDSIKVHLSAPYRILARIIGVKRVCYEWRNFLEKEPEEAYRIIDDLSKRFGLRDQIAIQIANFDMKSLPLQNIAQLKRNLVSFVESFLIEHKDDLISAVRHIEVEAMGTVRSAIIRFNPESIPAPWLERTKRDLSTFCYTYLQRELGMLVEKALPALGMYTLIARKIDLFPPQQLEEVIKRICKDELKWLSYLGAFIGFWLGLVQVAVNISVH